MHKGMVKEEVDVHYFLPSAVYCYALQGLHHFTLTSHIINLMSSILSFSLHVIQSVISGISKQFYLTYSDKDPIRIRKLFG